MIRLADPDPDARTDTDANTEQMSRWAYEQCSELDSTCEIYKHERVLVHAYT